MGKPRTWKCSRQEAGVRCGASNPARLRLCQACGKPRPPRKRAAHLAALDLDYAAFVELNGGVEACAICGKRPSANRRLDRDHCHKSGRARGLLCARCNRALPGFITPEWLREAAKYLEERTA